MATFHKIQQIFFISFLYITVRSYWIFFITFLPLLSLCIQAAFGKPYHFSFLDWQITWLFAYLQECLKKHMNHEHNRTKSVMNSEADDKGLILIIQPAFASKQYVIARLLHKLLTNGTVVSPEPWRALAPISSNLVYTSASI